MYMCVLTKKEKKHIQISVYRDCMKIIILKFTTYSLIQNLFRFFDVHSIMEYLNTHGEYVDKSVGNYPTVGELYK